MGGGGVFQNLGPLPFQAPTKKNNFWKANFFPEDVGDGGGGGGLVDVIFSKTKVPETFRKTPFFQKFPKFSAKKSRGGWTGGHVHSLTNHHNVSTFALRAQQKQSQGNKKALEFAYFSRSVCKFSSIEMHILAHFDVLLNILRLLSGKCQYCFCISCLNGSLHSHTCKQTLCVSATFT